LVFVYIAIIAQRCVMCVNSTYLETNAGTFLMLHVFDALSSTLRLCKSYYVFELTFLLLLWCNWENMN